MYNYAYEADILAVLRVLKVLHQQEPDAARKLCSQYGKVSEESLYILINEAIWEVFTDTEFLDDEENGFSSVEFSHPEIDRFVALGRKLAGTQGLPGEAWLRKAQDIVEYFVGGESYSIIGRMVRFLGTAVVVHLDLSPDCYEPFAFADSLMDMLACFQQENRRMEEHLAKEDQISLKEAA